MTDSNTSAVTGKSEELTHSTGVWIVQQKRTWEDPYLGSYGKEQSGFMTVTDSVYTSKEEALSVASSKATGSVESNVYNRSGVKIGAAVKKAGDNIYTVKGYWQDIDDDMKPVGKKRYVHLAEYRARLYNVCVSDEHNSEPGVSSGSSPVNCAVCDTPVQKEDTLRGVCEQCVRHYWHKKEKGRMIKESNL